VKKAVIVGSEGQDGRLLYELLARKGYGLVGISRGALRSNISGWRNPVDISKGQAVLDLIEKLKPDEVYYLAAFHHSAQDLPIENGELFWKSFEVHVLSLVHFLEGIRRFSRSTRIFYAASSHIFGAPKAAVQDESTRIAPNNVYGITKAAGLMTCRLYRERHGVFASVGILYNHESPLRDPRFVSRKIVQGILNIKRGKQKKLILGDLSSVVDWGYAPDYVEAMRRILGHSQADDFIVATGKKHTVGDFFRIACASLGLNWKACVEVRPGVLTKKKTVLVGNPRKLTRATGWKPSVTFQEMIEALLKAEKAA